LERDAFDLSGRVSVVTGAAGLLGREFCHALAEKGSSVALLDVDEESGGALAREVSKRHGHDAVFFGVDISRKASVVEATKKVVDAFGKVDVLINGARLKTPGMFAPFEDVDLEDWNRFLAVDLTAVFLCCQAMGPVMVRQRSGSIVNFSSIYGVVGPDQRIYEGTDFNSPAIYSTTKAGVLGLTRYLATYWAAHNVRVNAITPGGVENRHTDPFLSAYQARVPLKRMARAPELRGAVQFLSSDASSYVTGHNLVVDGGWTAW
jgi:NAD(P)-dependent dehydrogenase (short-subunit alcohol dehydrogenase family)